MGPRRSVSRSLRLQPLQRRTVSPRDALGPGGDRTGQDKTRQTPWAIWLQVAVAVACREGGAGRAGRRRRPRRRGGAGASGSQWSPGGVSSRRRGSSGNTRRAGGRARGWKARGQHVSTGRLRVRVRVRRARAAAPRGPAGRAVRPPRPAVRERQRLTSSGVAPAVHVREAPSRALGRHRRGAARRSEGPGRGFESQAGAAPRRSGLTGRRAEGRARGRAGPGGAGRAPRAA